MDLAALRAQKDDFFRAHPHSPLTEAQKRTFTGLDYFPPNPDLVFQVTVEVFAEQAQILMRTNRDELKPFYRYGAFAVTVSGATATLTIYRSPEGNYFLPFTDTSPDTYPAGRYLDLDPLEERVFVVDFNRAYNPYCAYNDRWVCPVPPPENRLDVPIEAGEKLPTNL